MTHEEFLEIMAVRLHDLDQNRMTALLDFAESLGLSKRKNTGRGQAPERRLDAMDERLNNAARVVNSVARFMHKLEKRVDRLEADAPEVQMKVTKTWFDNNAARIGGLELENSVLRKKLYRTARR